MDAKGSTICASGVLSRRPTFVSACTHTRKTQPSGDEHGVQGHTSYKSMEIYLRKKRDRLTEWKHAARTLRYSLVTPSFSANWLDS